MRRYETAIRAVSPSPPIAATAGPARSRVRADSPSPSATESHNACAPILPAAATSPAPCSRATRAVVP
jgi:hypothetical protein